jgi:uncharacterized protein (DUF58 family)
MQATPNNAHRELLRRVRQIEIRTRQRVEDLLGGEYHSAFKGRGIEFEEVRPYQVGDDVRTIDWNVTARSGEPFVKLFREERELTVMLLVDLSASQSIGTAGQLKRELIAELGATLAFSAIRNNDKVGLIGFSDRIEKVVPVRKGRRHVLRVIRELLYTEPVSTGTDIAAALEHLNKTTRRRAVVFLISDFQDEGYRRAMTIASRKHDLVPIVVSDPRERSLPNVGLVELFDAETRRRVLVDTSSRRGRKQYEAIVAAGEAQRDELFARLSLDAVHLETDQDIVEPLRRFFRRREVRQCR